MKTVWLVIAIHAGLAAGGFLLAGVMRFAELARVEREKEKKTLLNAVASVEPTGVAYLGLAVWGMGKFWGADGTGRRMIWLGAVAVGLMVFAMVLK